MKRSLFLLVILTALVVVTLRSHDTPPSAGSPASTTAAPPPAGNATLTQLIIDDHPHTDADYRRDEWPHWLDIDGDGCDAREQALIAASTVTAQVGAGCKVLSGRWLSAYDGKATAQPGDEDVDHVVPLAEVHRSGGWSWSTDRRTLYANDQADLWVVSAASNRSKGDSPPNEWRPPRHESWCTYARRWTDIKVRWGLTATTAERDALGQMLEAC